MGISVLKMFSIVFVAATVTVTHVTSSGGDSSGDGKYALATFDSNGDGTVDANDIAACREGRNEKFNNFYSDTFAARKILSKLEEKMRYEGLTEVDNSNWGTLDLSEAKLYAAWVQDLKS